MIACKLLASRENHHDGGDDDDSNCYTVTKTIRMEVDRIKCIMWTYSSPRERSVFFCLFFCLVSVFVLFFFFFYFIFCGSPRSFSLIKSPTTPERHLVLIRSTKTPPPPPPPPPLLWYYIVYTYIYIYTNAYLVVPRDPVEVVGWYSKVGVVYYMYMK